MKALILCAGQGSRLEHLTASIPKCMVPLLGRPLFDYQIETFSKCGIENVSLATGFAEGKFDKARFRCFHNPDFASSNMVTSLFQAAALFDGSEDLIVAYSDIVYETKVLRKLMDSKHHITTVIDKTGWRKLWAERMNDPLSDLETLILNQDGTIREIGQKPKNYSSIGGQYVGLTKFSAGVQKQVLEFFNSMDRSLKYDGKDFANMYMTSFLQALINSGHSVSAAQIDGGWLEVDTVSDLEKYEDLSSRDRLLEFWDPSSK